MTIRDRDRKILWSRAGNGCSICQTILVREGDVGAGLSVIGEECHIVSPAGRGPRAGQATDDLDGYENLILLCPNDHRLVDTLVDDWPAQRLLEIKRSHEEWVKATLARSKGIATISIVRGEPATLRRLWTAKEVLSVAADADEASLDHEDLQTEEELDIVANFIQLVHDWTEIWADVEPASRMRATFELDREMKSLEEHGWIVFGERARGQLRGGVASGDLAWETAFLRIVRTDSPTILRLDLAEDPSAAEEAPR